MKALKLGIVNIVVCAAVYVLSIVIYRFELDFNLNLTFAEYQSVAPTPGTVYLNELKLITDALIRYKDDHGFYPHDNFSSLSTYMRLSRNGAKIDNWIPGLVPDYISSLPNIPDNEMTYKNQFFYFSDGITFKLIALIGHDFTTDIERMDKITDPARPKTAYGFWSINASRF